jgi:hypothetical protein
MQKRLDRAMEFTASPQILDERKAALYEIVCAALVELEEQEFETQKGVLEKMCDLIESLSITDEKRESFRENMCTALLRLKNPAFETQKDLFWKQFDLLESPQKKLKILDSALESKNQKFYAQSDWKKRVELAIAIEDSRARFRACSTLLGWAGSLYREASWIEGSKKLMDGNKSYRAFLIDITAKIAEEETDIAFKAPFYAETLFRAKDLHLWDAAKIADWNAEYELVLAKLPGAKKRFDLLCEWLDVESQRNESAAIAIKNARIDRLLVAVREIPAQDYNDRLLAFEQTATIARRSVSPERTREIINEALAYAESMPRNESTRQEINLLLKLKQLRDRLPQ